MVDKLITAIETGGGLYTVGLYRKAGAAAKIKALIKEINTGWLSFDSILHMDVNQASDL